MKSIACLLSVALFVLLFYHRGEASENVDSPGLATVKKGSPIYAAGLQTSSVTGTLKEGDSVTIDLEVTGGGGAWCHVTSKSDGQIQGFVPCDCLEQKEQAAPAWKSEDHMEAQVQVERGTTTPGLKEAVERAIASGDMYKLKSLLEKGTDPNEMIGETRPLIMAAKSYLAGNLKTVKLLLDFGANAQAQDRKGNTALWYARQQRDYQQRMLEGFRREHGGESGSGLAETAFLGIIARYREIEQLLENASSME